MLDVLIVAFTTGALGSVGHCLGMCGGFCIAVTSAGRKAVVPSAGGAQAGYHAGRTLTYTVLGAFFGGLGSVGGLAGEYSAAVNMGVAILAGVVMIYAGLVVMGLLPERAGPTALLPEKFFRRALEPSGRSPFVFGFHAGLVLGLLPCGLLLAAEAQAAATGSAWKGGLVLLAFALGTVPALALGSTLLERLSLGARQKAYKLAGVLLVLWGCWSLARPFIPHDHGGHGTLQMEGSAPAPEDPHAHHHH